MRIVAGSLGSRRLVAPRGRATRPTSDRARESLFAMLGEVTDARCLDLFAGSGALGLEALSRGAATCTFVEIERAALDALRANVETLGVGSRARIAARDARRVLRDAAAVGEAFDLVLVDPPYAALQSYVPVLDSHLRTLVPLGGRVVVESATGAAPELDGFACVRERRVGAANLSILVRADVPDDGER